ncbi:MAG: rRNA maturation RNase YbeY [Rhizobium pusense]|nr:rRNA maturation RNase YbeY [Agrobacterium pusense]
MTALDIQISIEAEGWSSEEDLSAFASKALDAAVDFLKREEDQPFPKMPVELSLNAEWRDKDKATNVLSFPAFPLEPGGMPGPMLGDIVVARETVEREALELEKSYEDHLTHLLVHGFLHLFGYDHMDEEEAEEMESLETRILAVLGLSDTYAGQEPL